MESLVTDVVVDLVTTTTTENGSTLTLADQYNGEEPIDVYFAIDLYLTPVWYAIGIPGNILAYCVWTRRRMRLSSGCYLAALALDECIFLVMQVFFELDTKWDLKLLGLPGLCQAFPVLFLTSQHLSPLLVLAFTTERYVSVCHPFHRERFCSTRRAVAAIVALSSFALALNAAQGYFWTYDGEKAECTLRPEVLEGGSSSLWTVWSWVTELFIFGVVPLVILLLNVLVIDETRRISAAERRFKCSVQLSQPHKETAHETTHVSNHYQPHTGAVPHSPGPTSSRPSATTFMLLAVSFYLIATTLPVTVCYVLNPTFPPGDEEMTDDERLSDPVWTRHVVYNNVRTIIYEIGLSHYASNLYIYLVTGRMFRRELRRLVCRWCPAACVSCGRSAAGNDDSTVGGRSVGNRAAGARSAQLMGTSTTVDRR